MVDEYKYYFFYRCKDEKELYAYTQDKKIAKRFKNDRRNFYKMKKVLLTREEVNELAKNHRHSIITDIKARDKMGEIKGFLCTEDEFINISDYSIHRISRVSSTVMGDMRFINIVKDRYLDALAYLLYIKTYRLVKYGKIDYLFDLFETNLVGTFVTMYKKELSDECIGYLLFG